MANNISNVLNSRLRFSGLSSGLDTDTIIKQLMKIEKTKVDKVQKDKTLLEWKRDEYRSITNTIRSFKDEFFNIVKPSTNFRSQTAFTSYDTRSDNEAIATVKASIGAAATTHTLNVKNLATSAVIKSDAEVTSLVNAGTAVSDFNLQGKQIEITLDGIKKTISLENYTDVNDLKTKLQASIDTAFGKVNITTSKLNISVDVDKLGINTSLNGSTFSIAEVSGGALSSLGFNANDNLSNKVSLTSPLDGIRSHLTAGADAVFLSSDNVQFTINGNVVNLGKTFAEASINDVMTAVNNSSAGVLMKYDSLNDKFTLTSKATGSTEAITMSDTSGLLSSLGIKATNLEAGEDALFDLDGIVNMQRSTNEFSIDGATYTLKSDASPGITVNVTVSANVDNLVDKIKSFISKYNEVIDKVNGEISEKKDRGYVPLTEEEKKSMSEDDIKKWESKAKEGLLRSDSILSSIANNMRKALNDVVSGSDISLYKIGITTGSYEMKGKLIVDETKLRTAINDNAEGVAKLFNQESQYSYTDGQADSTKRTTRYNESGLAQRLFDIIQDNIRTTRDTKGNKGALLEKAGISGDISEFSNLMNKSIQDKDTIIDKLIDKLVDKESALYTKFTAMEKALSQMNSQSSWLSQQTSA